MDTFNKDLTCRGGKLSKHKEMQGVFLAVKHQREPHALSKSGLAPSLCLNRLPVSSTNLSEARAGLGVELYFLCVC